MMTWTDEILYVGMDLYTFKEELTIFCLHLIQFVAIDRNLTDMFIFVVVFAH